MKRFNCQCLINFLLFVLIGIHKCFKITQVKINLTLNQPFPILISDCERDIVINSLTVGWGCMDKIDYDGRLFWAMNQDVTTDQNTLAMISCKLILNRIFEVWIRNQHFHLTIWVHLSILNFHLKRFRWGTLFCRPCQTIKKFLS